MGRHADWVAQCHVRQVSPHGNVAAVSSDTIVASDCESPTGVGRKVPRACVTVSSETYYDRLSTLLRPSPCLPSCQVATHDLSHLSVSLHAKLLAPLFLRRSHFRRRHIHTTPARRDVAQ
eukprot:6457953-Prymnesium_polylepis.1